MANPTPSKAAISTKQILVIDDDSSIREVVSICLRTLGGWNVHKASTGHEGLVIAQTKAPDIIILDVMMPGMNGFQVIAVGSRILNRVKELRSYPAKDRADAPENNRQG